METETTTSPIQTAFVDMEFAILESNSPEPIPECCGCKYYYTEQEQDGWENPFYTVPFCDRPKGRGSNGRPRLLEDGSIEDWPVWYCRHRRVK